jgi:hypothetical protein
MELPSKEIEVAYKAEVGTDGNVILKKKDNIKRGKKSKTKGNQFETKVRKDLEEKGWTVDKWSNNIDLEEQKIVPAKRKFNPFSKVMTIGTGFPDFIAYKKMGDYYKIIGVEVKTNGTLSSEEKKKCQWYQKEQTFNELLIAKKVLEGRKIKVSYEEFKNIEQRMKKKQ